MKKSDDIWASYKVSEVLCDVPLFYTLELYSYGIGTTVKNVVVKIDRSQKGWKFFDGYNWLKISRSKKVLLDMKLRDTSLKEPYLI